MLIIATRRTAVMMEVQPLTVRTEHLRAFLAHHSGARLSRFSGPFDLGDERLQQLVGRVEVVLIDRACEVIRLPLRQNLLRAGEVFLGGRVLELLVGHWHHSPICCSTTSSTASRLSSIHSATSGRSPRTRSMR